MRVTEAIKCKFQNMKYRHKLIVLLVTASLAPMILLVWYSHDRMSSLLYEKEMEDMSSILEQTGEGVDSQIEVFSSLLNYLTYSPDIEDLITEKNMDNYYAYKKYTEVADPLLTRALCATRKILLLDEPVSGLDPVATADMYQIISELNKEDHVTIIMISHDIGEVANYASHVLHIGHRLFFGTKEEYMNSKIGKHLVTAGEEAKA